MQLPNVPSPIGATAGLKAKPSEAVGLRHNQISSRNTIIKPGIETNKHQVNTNINTATNINAETTANIKIKPGTEAHQDIQQSGNLLRAQAFTPMSEEDIQQTITSFKMPFNSNDIKLAKGMLEHGMPLTPENFTDMKEAMSLLPKNLSTDMQAASFLKLSSLPLTTQNITTLSNFITNHPLIGAQLIEIQSEFKKIANGDSVKTSREMIEMLEMAPGLLGEYMVDVKNQSKKKNAEVPKKMARQVGIEMMGRGYGQEEEDMDLLRMLMTIRARLEKESSGRKETDLLKVFSLIADVGECINAQQLINKARKNDDMGYFYFQVPIKIDGREFTGEIRIYYTTDYYERKTVDEDNTLLDFSVETDHLGHIRFHLEIDHGIINMEIATEREEVRQFTERFVPVLMENIKKLRYRPGSAKCYVNYEESDYALPMFVQEFEKLERVSFTC